MTKKAMSKRTIYYVPVEGYDDEHGFRASVVVEDEPGHRPTGTYPFSGALGETRPYFWGHDYVAAQAIADGHNARMGITKEEATSILASSIRAANGG